jgi:hypothetical protein
MEYTRAHTNTSSLTHTHARTHARIFVCVRMCVCVCAWGPREGEFAMCLCPRVSESVRVHNYARGAVPACVRGCAAASMRMRGVHALFFVRACARICARAQVRVRARARARLCMRAFVCACERVLPVYRQSIFAHACGRGCVRICVARMCVSCLGGLPGAAVARRRPAVFIARPAAPGGGARCGCG